MDHAGTSVISAKPTDNVTSVYNNLAFSHDNLAKDDPQNMTVNGSVNININNDTATIPKNNSSGRLSSSSDKAGRHPDDVSHPKRGPSSVDFTMPEKQPRDAPKVRTLRMGYLPLLSRLIVVIVVLDVRFD